MIYIDNKTDEILHFEVEGDGVKKPYGVVAEQSVDTLDAPGAEVHFKISFWRDERKGLPVASVMDVSDKTRITVRESTPGVFTATKSQSA